MDSDTVEAAWGAKKDNSLQNDTLQNDETQNDNDTASLESDAFALETSESVQPSEQAAQSALPRQDFPAGITVDENGTLWVDESLLIPNPRQPRQFFDEEKLEELTASVKQEGVLSPIIIEDAGNGSFFIIAGERRTKAARRAGLKKLPVQLRKYSDSRKLEVALIENIQRADLNPVEEARAYYQLMELENITQEEVAKRVGKNRSTVANCIRLLKLPDEMQQALAAGQITSGHARALLSVISPSDQKTMFDRIIDKGLSVRQCESLAQELNGGKRSLPTLPKEHEQDKRDPNYIAMEQKFIEELGTKVVLKGDFNSGTVTINYFSADDLDRIYNRIVNKQ